MARIAKPLRRVKLGTQGGARESNLLSVPVRMMPECCGPADFASQALAVHYAPKNGLCNDGGNHCVHGCAVAASKRHLSRATRTHSNSRCSGFNQHAPPPPHQRPKVRPEAAEQET